MTTLTFPKADDIVAKNTQSRAAAVAGITQAMATHLTALIESFPEEKMFLPHHIDCHSNHTTVIDKWRLQRDDFEPLWKALKEAGWHVLPGDQNRYFNFKLTTAAEHALKEEQVQLSHRPNRHPDT